MPAVEVINVSKSFRPTPALEEVSLSLEPGKAICLSGPSGCGKTTLLRIVAGLERPDTGTVRIGGCLVSGNGIHVPPTDRNLNMVFQDFALWPHMRVQRHLDFVLRATPLPRRDRRQRIDELLAAVRLEDKRRAFPRELSGGQQQRLAIARALATRPALLLLDEPFSNLDPDLRDHIRNHFLTLKSQGTALLIATHDPNESEALGDLTLALKNSW